MNDTEIIVRVADLRVANGASTLVTLGLGSCVAIMLHDPQAKVGGMAHILLPNQSLARRGGNPAKFPQTAVPALIDGMRRLGADPRRVTARLAGGASMFAALVPAGQIQMGERNIVATREVLGQHGIPIVGEAVGGDYGRSVRFHVATGAVRVSAVTRGAVEL